MRPCRFPGCGELVARGYCKAHQPETTRGRRGDPRYRTKRWRRLSAAFLRAHPECVECGMLATDVDHVLAVEDNPGISFWDTSNWQGLCHADHSRKTRREVANRTFH